MINSKGEDVPATAANVSGSSDSFIQQEDHSSQQNQTSQSNQLNSGATTSSGTLTSNQLSSGITTYLGTVTFASDMQQRVGSESVPPKTAPVSISEPTDRRIAKEVQPLIEPSVEVKAEESPDNPAESGNFDQ
jgi:hypothetical protein